LWGQNGFVSVIYVIGGITEVILPFPEVERRECLARRNWLLPGQNACLPMSTGFRY